MPIRRLKTYLDSHHIRYLVMDHSPAFSALEVAEYTHISGRFIAKTVILIIEDQPAMVVLPGTEKVDLEFFKEFCDTHDVRLATEEEFREIFPDCEVGAMPPFGNLYGINVYVAKSLTEDDEIAFNAGNHHQIIKMKYSDLDRLVHPVVLDFSVAPIHSLQI